MRNDEKIDIQLSAENNDDLSAEELAQQNYNTALRYINIAEHMKQFEDQDKYYHRAIKYLRLAQPYMEVRPLLRDLRHKKFTARAEGKIALYEEACRIRDKAKTPSDYYSAQTVFDRIHRHELTHNLPEKRISPELYARVQQCADAEQQAIYCEQKAAEKAAEIKKHSLLVTLCFIVVIAALLAFSRTTAFRRGLAAIAAVTQDHRSAWQSYRRIYDKTGDADALAHYKEQRYKAALHEAKKDDPETIQTAITDFHALAQENYKDSSRHLLALEQQVIVETQPGEIVTFANMDWRILDKQKDKTLLIKDKAMGDLFFQEGDASCTWETSSIRNWLNTTFLEENFSDAEIAAIPASAVPASDNPVYHTSGGKDTVDQVFLLSSEEVKKYQDTLHETKSCWWLRTPGATPDSMSFTYMNKTVMDTGYDYHTNTFTVKPAIWVNTAAK